MVKLHIAGQPMISMISLWATGSHARRRRPTPGRRRCGRDAGGMLRRVALLALAPAAAGAGACVSSSYDYHPIPDLLRQPIADESALNALVLRTCGAFCGESQLVRWDMAVPTLRVSHAFERRVRPRRPRGRDGPSGGVGRGPPPRAVATDARRRSTSTAARARSTSSSRPRCLRRSRRSGTAGARAGNERGRRDFNIARCRHRFSHPLRRTHREHTIRPNVGRNDVDATEIERLRRTGPFHRPFPAQASASTSAATPAASSGTSAGATGPRRGARTRTTRRGARAAPPRR